MAGMSTEQQIWLLMGAIVVLVLLAFFCFYHPDCSVCQFMDAFG